MTRYEFRQLRPGERVRLGIIKSTLRGTVTRVNDNHTIHIRWDDGQISFKGLESAWILRPLVPKPSRLRNVYEIVDELSRFGPMEHIAAINMRQEDRRE